MGNWADSSYQVAQAVAGDILGPYRKLTEAEGGILISGSIAGSEDISGTGHHTVLEVGSKLYIVYHRHDDFVVAGSARNAAIDELKWITVKDKDGNDLEVLYANGPTCTVQPKIDAFADYVNIAGEAKVSGSEDAAFLNDGLLSIYKYAHPDFISNIQETTISETTTFTFDFDTAQRTLGNILIEVAIHSGVVQNEGVGTAGLLVVAVEEILVVIGLGLAFLKQALIAGHFILDLRRLAVFTAGCQTQQHNCCQQQCKYLLGCYSHNVMSPCVLKILDLGYP